MNKRSKRIGIVAGLAVAALGVGGTAGAMIAGGPTTPMPPAGPMADKQLAACLDAHRASCPDPNLPQHRGVKPQAAQPAQMTRDQAVAAALGKADPKAKATSAITSSNLEPLSSYEKATYNGAHVNAALAPSTQVWVVTVNAAPNPAEIDTPPGQKPKVYTHYTVVIDASTHHWVEEDYQQ
ncbi:hypothetical protein [Kutzneria buriramensis]|uniref:Uncharacterized protein n=1 Tax=Kutzneria buriramensis TaxID=1045776 RepID=A0A3E0I540_9PSEU|nr:hypothetical protein [Kutzneria buriramensis]REH53874.1 hypothetical protein BCF44_10295 [Kutzneria buriramensis]